MPHAHCRLDADVGFSEQKRRYLHVAHTGVMKWYVGGEVIHTPCQLDMHSFPFDGQECKMKVGSYTLDSGDVELVHDNRSKVSGHLGANSMWDVISWTASVNYFIFNESETEEGVRYDHLLFQLSLRRKSTYYIINIITPCVFISILMCAVFVLPAEGGEKISFSITLFVAFTVIQLVIVDMMPKTSDSMPVMGWYHYYYYYYVFCTSYLY